MEDTVFTSYGFQLRPESEYLSVFNHILLKGVETGILKRLDQVWNPHRKPPIRIGMTEPESLSINNVMFPFSYLGVAIIIALSIAFIEKALYRVKNQNALGQF